MSTPDEQEILQDSSNEFRKKLFERIHGISSAFKINYALSPKLKYEYPPINPIIIENIVSALISCPKFYTQTLHLMNKMNLPCPLVPYVRIPRAPMLNQQNMQVDEIKLPPVNVDLTHVDMSTSESESEIESDHDSNVKSRTEKNKRDTPDPSKSAEIKSKTESLEEAFEKLTGDFSKQASANKNVCTKTTETENILYQRAIVASEFEGFAKIVPNVKQAEVDANKLEIENTSSANADNSEFISKYVLENNRLKMSELKELPIFKNYERGEVNTRIYLKNVAKKCEEKDLRFIYGRYIDWSNPAHVNAFDIRLMKEGRMKGQAFITLPSEEIAEKALNETNGYLLEADKPIVVQFARSAKPK